MAVEKINAEALARWIAVNQPKLFAKIAEHARVPAKSMAGIFDALASFGTAASSAISQVGSFIASPAGLSAIGTLGGAYLQSQVQKDALSLQLAQVKAGKAPAPLYATSTAVSPTGYMYQPSTLAPAQPFTQSLARSLLPAGITVNEVLIGAVALGLVFFATRRR